MESLTHNVKDMLPETRRGFETALGETLLDDQRVYVVVVTPGVEPSDRQRAEADQALDEGMENIRSSPGTP